jgi:hypothetical protein
MAGAACALTVGILSLFCSHSDIAATVFGSICFAIGFGIAGALAAALPGALLGAAIGTGKLRSEGECGFRGMHIAMASQFLPPAAVCIFVPASVQAYSLLIITIGGLLALVVCGIVTLPIGWFAGTLLYRHRDSKPRGPLGCKRHGYRQ